MQKLILIISLLCLFLQGKTQDRHYWSQMGGITAGLLGGSAIAGLKDNSSLYYNAAAMSFVNNPSISLGANTYRFRILNIDNAFGKDLNQNVSGFVFSPDLIGGLLFSKKNDRLRFGYAIAVRFLTDNSFSAEASGITEDNNTRIGDFDFLNRTQETWISSANSYKVSDHVSYGFSFIVAIRSQTYANFIGSKIIPKNTNNDVSRFDSRVNFNYWNVKGLLRLSMAFDYETFRFGWNATLPSLNLFGNAFIKREFGLVNNPKVLNDLPKDVILSGSDDKLSTKNKYPFTTAIGASFKLNNGDWLHFSAEMFLPIKKYVVFSTDVEPVAFPKNTLDSIADKYFSDVKFLEYSEQAKFVINFSMGYESFLTEKWGLLAGFRTDFNFNSADDFDLGELRPYYSNWDIYYFSGGVWGIIKDKKITAGIELGLSPKTKVRQLVNFDGVDSPDYPLLGDPSNSAIASQLLIRFYLGIEINFERKDKVNDKI